MIYTCCICQIREVPSARYWLCKDCRKQFPELAAPVKDWPAWAKYAMESNKRSRVCRAEEKKWVLFNEEVGADRLKRPL